jgi:hypothetical protein
MEQIRTVAGHRFHLDHRKRYQILQPPLVDRTDVQRDQAQLWSNQCLAVVATDIGLLDHAHFPELQSATVTITLTGRQKGNTAFPYTLASPKSSDRWLDRQSSAVLFPTCQHQGLLGSKIPKICASQRGVYSCFQKSSIDFPFFTNFFSG